MFDPDTFYTGGEGHEINSTILPTPKNADTSLKLNLQISAKI